MSVCGRGLILAVAVSIWAGAAQAQVLKLNEKQELEIGRRAAAQIEMEQPMFDDPKVLGYVQKVGIRLARESGRPGVSYHFKIIQSSDVNAYALPGGFIYVTMGLLEAVRDESELAGVLAHEIGHIAARQHASKIRRSQLASLGVSFLGPVMGGGVRAAAAVRGGRTSARGLFMRFTKENEREADRMAAKNLYAAGYDPEGMIRFLRRLNGLHEDDPGSVKGYFSSHSSLEDRADSIRDLIETFPPKEGLRRESPELPEIQAHIRAVKPAGALASSAAAAAVIEAAEDEPESEEAKDREIAALFAPIFYQGLGDEPRFDYITKFDFDGDWRGDNNWAHAGKDRYAMPAWVYYSVRETRTHYFLHYAVFHPRDYKGGMGRGTLFSKVIRTAAKPAAKVDPTGRVGEAVLAHENDLEGCLIVVEKRGGDPKDGKVLYVETLAHNNFLKYVPTDSPREGFETVTLHGRRAKLFIEPKGHGIEAYRAEGEQTKVPLLLYTFTGFADVPDPEHAKPVGYDLAPIATTLWLEALRGVTPTYAETEDYGTLLLDVAEGDSVREATIPVGRIGSAFRGRVGGANLARPPWGWFDGKDKDQPLGQWYFDPARTIRRDFGLDDSFPTAYLRLGELETLEKRQVAGYEASVR
ncbi:MAG: M48 family metallopeptidase [Bryobacteraceae bacterium]